MNTLPNLPVGIENFEKIRRGGFYHTEEKGYTERLRLDGMEMIFKYGITCSRKRCNVQGKQESLLHPSAPPCM